MKNTLLLSTRKGLLTYRRTNHGSWSFNKVDFIGIPVSLSYADSLTNTWWACLDHGHWGCKLHRSKDEGKTWAEARRSTLSSCIPLIASINTLID